MLKQRHTSSRGATGAVAGGAASSRLAARPRMSRRTAFLLMVSCAGVVTVLLFFFLDPAGVTALLRFMMRKHYLHGRDRSDASAAVIAAAHGIGHIREPVEEHVSSANREGVERRRQQLSDAGTINNRSASLRQRWDEDNFPLADVIVSSRCDLERRLASDLSREEFKSMYLEKKPVVLVNATDTREFTALVQRGTLLDHWGDMLITLSTANKNSYQKREVRLRDYVVDMMGPTPLSALGNTSWYHFGHNRRDEWAALFRHYATPSKYIFGPHASLSFGLGGSASGVPFHTHGHVFAEVFYGRKRWFLQAPGPQPRFEPDDTSLHWLVSVLPTFTPVERASLLDCTLGPGEMLYIPSFWHHATLNIGETVFMSTFV